MGRSKTQKFIDNEASSNVIQPGKTLYEKISGNWNKSYFNNENDIVIELACGKGEYTIGLAQHFPGKNFIGIDIKGARIWSGSQKAQELKLNNVAFLRIHIQNLENHFKKNEISEIWIIHPDPRPKKSDERRRLTNNRFLDMYKRLIKSGGIVRLKTDNDLLYDYTLQTLKQRNDVEIVDTTENLYTSELNSEHFDINTKYEQKFSAEGHLIKYLKFYFQKQ